MALWNVLIVCAGFIAISAIVRWLYEKYNTRERNLKWLANSWAILVTFTFISFTRLFFRSGSNLDPATANEVAWKTAKSMVQQMGTSWNVNVFDVIWAYHNVFLLFVLGMIIHWIPEKTKRRYRYTFASLPLASDGLDSGCGCGRYLSVCDSRDAAVHLFPVLIAQEVSTTAFFEARFFLYCVYFVFSFFFSYTLNYNQPTTTNLPPQPPPTRNEWFPPKKGLAGGSIVFLVYWVGPSLCLSCAFSSATRRNLKGGAARPLSVSSSNLGLVFSGGPYLCVKSPLD